MELVDHLDQEDIPQKINYFGCGGGGGWYGGSAGSDYAASGGGGSGYVLTKNSERPVEFTLWTNLA